LANTQPAKTVQKGHNLSENASNPLLSILERLSLKEPNLKLNFQDVTLDLGKTKARFNGVITLDFVYPSESKTQV
jgi:hypothetical protein